MNWWFWWLTSPSGKQPQYYPVDPDLIELLSKVAVITVLAIAVVLLVLHFGFHYDFF